ncbi:18475_t:CDS:1, partial [Racocetra persica]
ESFEQEETGNSIIEQSEENDASALNFFLEEIRNDYQNSGPQYRTALNKFIKRYRVSKSISIPRLTSFLHDINHTGNSTRVKSGAMIRVQVESVKRRKREGHNGNSRAVLNEIKENRDSQIIPYRKKRKVNKKEHNL